MDIFEETVGKIKSEYHNNPNDLGWRFLTTSKKTLIENNGIFFITLNPGGNTIPKHHGTASCENGNAYCYETWKSSNQPGESPLQQQFQMLFKEISNRLKENNHIKILENSVCGYFIPFRSPTFNKLKNKQQCLSFSLSIWKEILKNTDPNVLICIDKVTYENLDKILCGDYIREQTCYFEIGWGNYKATIIKYVKQNRTVLLTRFPHLSRFKIFGRPKSEKHINKIFDYIMTNTTIKD